MKKWIPIVLLAVFVSTAYAETRYITDELKVTMRSGESSSHRILRMLKSGTAVTVLSSNATNGYSEIQLSNGKTGYVLTSQLMKDPSAREQLVSVRAKLDALQAEPDALAARLTSLEEKYSSLQREASSLTAQRDQLASELESLKFTSQNAVRITQERNTLRTRVQELDMQVQELRQKNSDLSRRTTQNWFMIGAGVIVLGIILGLILPHLRFQKRRSSWGDL